MSTEVKPTDWDAEDNMWEPTPSGGGSGLPSFTSADKGKVLTIGKERIMKLSNKNLHSAMDLIRR